MIGGHQHTSHASSKQVRPSIAPFKLLATTRGPVPRAPRPSKSELLEVQVKWAASGSYQCARGLREWRAVQQARARKSRRVDGSARGGGDDDASRGAGSGVRGGVRQKSKLQMGSLCFTAVLFFYCRLFYCRLLRNAVATEEG